MGKRLPYSVWQSTELRARLSRFSDALDLACNISKQYETEADASDAQTVVMEWRGKGKKPRLVARYRSGSGELIAAEAYRRQSRQQGG